MVSEFIEEAQIPMGMYDPVASCKYSVPSYWDIEKVYQRLILMVNDAEEKYAEMLIKVLTS